MWSSQHAKVLRSMPKGNDERTAKSMLTEKQHESKLRTLLVWDQRSCEAQDLCSLLKAGGNVLLIKAGLDPLEQGSGLSLAMGRLKSQALSIPAVAQESLSALRLHNWPGAH